jgi:hypothetical protein
MSTLTLHRVNCKEATSFILPKHNITSRSLKRPLAPNSEHADHVAGNWFSNTSLQMTHSSINNIFFLLTLEYINCLLRDCKSKKACFSEALNLEYEIFSVNRH